MADLEWSKDEEEDADADLTEGEALDSEESDENNHLSERESSHDSPNEATSDGRIRRQPAWMRDYVSGERLSEDDDMAHLVLLADSDPITYEEVEKSAKWRKAMNSEIESIERNHT